MAFSLADMLADVSNLDTGVETGRQKIEYISVEQLHADPNNFYELSGIEQLAANIELLGLQQPIRVRKAEEGYTIVSGHRRTAAIRQLVAEGREDLKEVPCIVEAAASSPELQELRLIFANSDTRTMTSAELSRQAERVEELLYKLKEEQGMEFPGRMRDHVAEACKMSKSKLARLKVIRDNLQGECLRQAWEDGRLNESCAYEIARRSPEVQETADEMLHYLLKLPAEEVAAVMDRLEKEQEDRKRMQRNMETSMQRFSPPSSAESYEEYAAVMREEDAAFFSVLEVFAEDLLQVVPKMGTSRRDNIAAVKNSLRGSAARKEDAVYSGSGNVLAVCKGDQSVDWLRRNWTEAYDMLAAIALNRLREAGNGLPQPLRGFAMTDGEDYPSVGCADKEKTDCHGPAGLAMTGIPEPEWLAGLPKKDGRYLVKFDLGDGHSCDDVLEYDAFFRRFYFSTGNELDFPCIGWWPVPEGEGENLDELVEDCEEGGDGDGES